MGNPDARADVHAPLFQTEPMMVEQRQWLTSASDGTSSESYAYYTKHDEHSSCRRRYTSRCQWVLLIGARLHGRATRTRLA